MISNSHKVKNLLAKPLASLANKGFGLPVIVLSIITAVVLLVPGVGNANNQNTVHDFMSVAHQHVENGREFSDQTLNYQVDSTKKIGGIGHVTNTTFDLNAGVHNPVGCGYGLDLLNAVYPSGPTPSEPSVARNYTALNVFSRATGYDPDAPSINTSGLANKNARESSVPIKGYLTRLNIEQLKKTNHGLAYPYHPGFRVIPSIYPAYVGLLSNGFNCGRFLDVKTVQKSSVISTAQNCDASDSNGISKLCTISDSKKVLTQKHFTGIALDTCEDPNGWCRDSEAHVDFNTKITPENDLLSWKFIQNPYYKNSTEAGYEEKYQDIWLAWDYDTQLPPDYDHATIALLNLKNAISRLQDNIGTDSNPIWKDAGYDAGGPDIVWSAGTGNAAKWNIEPEGKSGPYPPAISEDWLNPTYQIRFWDINGYPGHNGAIYTFHLHNADQFDKSKKGSADQKNYLGKRSSIAYILFYEGISDQSVDSGDVQAPYTTYSPQGSGPIVKRTSSPIGGKTIKINFPPKLTDALKTIHKTLTDLHPVLINQKGFSYDAKACTANSCNYDGLPGAPPKPTIISRTVTGNTKLTFTNFQGTPHDITVATNSQRLGSTGDLNIKSERTSLKTSAQGIQVEKHTSTPFTETLTYSDGSTKKESCLIKTITVEGKPHTFISGKTTIPANQSTEKLELGYECSAPHDQTPLSATYHIYAKLYHSDSNDLELRKLRTISIDSNKQFSSDYRLNTLDYHLNTTYTGMVNVNLNLKTSSPPQNTGVKNSYETKDNQYVIPRIFFTLSKKQQSSNLIASIQGCWLHSYFLTDNNKTNCYIYYTQHDQDTFDDTKPIATFDPSALQKIGANKNSGYVLDSSTLPSVSMTPYDGVHVPYSPSISSSVNLRYKSTPSLDRSVFFIVDPQSDNKCSTDSIQVAVAGQNLNMTAKDGLKHLQLPFKTTGSLPVMLTDTTNPTHCTPLLVNSVPQPQYETVEPGINPILEIKVFDKHTPTSTKRGKP